MRAVLRIMKYGILLRRIKARIRLRLLSQEPLLYKPVQKITIMLTKLHHSEPLPKAIIVILPVPPQVLLLTAEVISWLSIIAQLIRPAEHLVIGEMDRSLRMDKSVFG